MHALLQDTRYGLRILAKSPAFTAVAIVTLALGIGANTAIFTVMNAVMLRSLPVQDAARLVQLRTDRFPDAAGQTGTGDLSFNLASFERLRAQREVFSDLFAYIPLSFSKAAVRYGEMPEQARGDMVSGNFFSGIGVRFAQGHGFTLSDELQHTQTVVLSYGYWARRFGGNPAILGQVLFVKGVPFTITGITARGFEGVDPNGATDFWIPLQNRAEILPWGASGSSERTTGLYDSPRWWFIMLIGRLAPRVAQQQALARLQPVFANSAYEGIGERAPKERAPQLSFGECRGVFSLRQAYEEPLRILMGMVALVLLIACSNVAMLLLARNTARQREFILRVALGARRSQLFRQLLTEGTLLVAAGAALGWLVAQWTSAAFAAWANFDVAMSADSRVLLFTLLLSALAAFVFGLLPLVSAANVTPAWALRTSATTAAQERARSLGTRLVVALQVALCLALMVGAGLLVRTLRNLQNVNLGVRTSGLVVFGVTAPPEAHAPDEINRFFQQLTGRLRALPGVESVTVMENRIGTGWSNNTTPYVDGAEMRNKLMRWNAVGPDYFRTLGVPLILGRDLSEADSAAAPRVAVVSQTFADRFLAGRSPIGHQLAFSNKSGARTFTIVGLVPDSKYTSVRERPVPVAYFSYLQLSGFQTLHFELRTSATPAAVLAAARAAVHEFGPDLPLLEPMTQREQFERSYAQERLFARLSMGFGLLAVVLVATGLYGTLAYRVSRRTAEIGVRMALGAQRQQVLWMVLRENLQLCVAGIALGLPLAFAATRLLRRMLFGLQPSDPLTYGLALAGLLAVALAASMLPARRATQVDPMVALRYE